MKLKKDIAVLLFFSALKVLAALYLIRLAESVLPLVLLGQFLLVRRYWPLLYNFLNFGVTQTLLRFLPTVQTEKNSENNYKLLGLLIWGSMAIICAIFYFLFQSFVADLLFPSNDYDTEKLAFWLVLLSIVTVPYLICLTDLVTKRHMILSNIGDLMCGFGWQIVAFWVLGDNVDPISILQINIVGCILVLVPYWGHQIYEISRTSGSFYSSNSRNILKNYINYGGSRAALPFLEPVLLVLGPFLMREDVVQAGYLIICLMFARILQSIFLPISRLSTVIASQKLSEGKQEDTNKGIRMLLGISLLSSGFGVALIYPWLNEFYGLWLNSENTVRGVTAYNLIFLSAIPLSVYSSLKGVIEVTHNLPLNLFNILASIIVSIVVFVFLSENYTETQSIIFSQLTLFFMVGIISIFLVRKRISFTQDIGVHIFIPLLGLVFLLNQACADFNAESILRYFIMLGGWVLSLFIVILSAFFLKKLRVVDDIFAMLKI